MSLFIEFANRMRASLESSRFWTFGHVQEDNLHMICIPFDSARTYTINQEWTESMREMSGDKTSIVVQESNGNMLFVNEHENDLLVNSVFFSEEENQLFATDHRLTNDTYEKLSYMEDSGVLKTIYENERVFLHFLLETPAFRLLHQTGLLQIQAISWEP